MPNQLIVPDEMGSRRRSEGCLEAFQSDMFQCKNKNCPEDSECRDEVPMMMDETQEQAVRNFLRHKVSTGVESNLLDVLRKNYDIVSALADIETTEGGPPGAHYMRGPNQRLFSPSKSLALRHFHPKNSLEYENASISSTETSEADVQESWWNWMSNELKWFLYDIAEAFEAPPSSEVKQPKADNQKLSAIALRRDLKRCYSFLHPLIEVGAAIYDTLLWKNPMHTLLLVLVYTYSIVRGWTASLVLLLLWTQLSLNYLKASKNVDIGLNFLPRKEVAMPKFDITGAQLIFDVAKFAQRLLNFAANFLEKLHSLLTWKDRHVTFVFYCLVIYWLALSMIFNTGTCLGMCGLTLGVRIFITTYLFHRFPRLRKRLDTYGWFYRNLPVKGTRYGSPVLVSGTEPLMTLASRAASPIPRRSLNPNGVFTSRLGSNFNLDTTGSQLSLNSRRNSSMQNLVHKGSMQNLTNNQNFKGSYDALNDQSVTPTQVQWGFSGPQSESLTIEPSINTFINRPKRSMGISPLVTIEQSSPNPPVDPSTSDSTPRIEEDDEEGTINSSTTSIFSEDDDEEAKIIHEDQMIDNILAYRSCVLNDKERTFPKGISSGIIYLTECALIYRTKSTSNDHAPLILLFADIISIKKIRSLRTVGLLTGTRKSLEIRMEGRRKPLQFIGLAQRDDFFSRIQIVCGDYSTIEFL
ncbi:GRAM domain-containing protein [Trichostrongylus colubriformis]|uniref:GRAM domain-containing protein n=1 Tax=Trichostrongylus colubriformis TaxID=6319 RepID=A0AAN8FKW6_TRICO